MIRECGLQGCDRTHYAKGYCLAHLRRHNAGKDMDPPFQHPQSVEERFWPKVDKSGDCWTWTASLSRSGYGGFGFRGKVWKAHRVSYVLAYGEIPDGAHILHSCDNPPCVNPAHLRAGTRSDNMQDKVRRGRDHQASQTHCKWGHEFSAENTYRTKYGSRQCRTCINTRKRARRAKLNREKQANGHHELTHSE